MNYPLLLVGVLLVIAVGYDIIQTALRVGQRGGPLTLQLASRLWRLALRFPHLLQWSGVLILLSIVAIWVAFSWLGWTLIFASSEESVLSTVGVPADLAGKIYFAGYTVFTLGNGDYQPVGGWEIVTVIATGAGLMLVTLSIAYLVPMLSAAVEKRALAAHISSLGRGSRELVQRLSNDPTHLLIDELMSFPRDLLLLRERHLAYPVLHYFQSREERSAVALNLAALDEALTVLDKGRAEVDPVTHVAAARIHRSIERLLEGLEPWLVTERPDAPPPPDLSSLDPTGDVVDQEVLQARLVDDVERRTRLRWMVQDTGWTWSDVTGDLAADEPAR